MRGRMMSVQTANKIRGGGKLSVFLLGIVAGILTATAGTLKWVGASGGAWNTTAQNWQDENGDPSAWVDGSIAEFGDDGGASITASGTINLGGLVFKGTTRPTISGGTLNFAAQMPINVNTYKGATISSALKFSNGFVANFVQPECAHPGLLTCRGYGTWDIYTGGTNTLWRNCRLEDLEIKSLYFHKVGSGGVINSALRANAYHPTWNGGELTIQFQYPNGILGNIDWVTLKFEQVGDDVTVKGMRIRSLKFDVNGEQLKLGDDFVALENAGLLSGGVSKIYDGVNTSGWCVYGSEIHAEPKGTLEFSGGFAHTNATTVIGACIVSNGTWQITGNDSGRQQHKFDTGDSLSGNGSLLIKHTGTVPTVYFDYRFANSLTSGLTIDGGKLTCHGDVFLGPQACGPGCPIRIINGGMLELNTYAHNTPGGNSDTGTTLYIGPNSRFTSSRSHRNLRWIRTIVDGGTLRSDFSESSSGTLSQEVFDLTLRNGAQVTEDAITIGSLRFGSVGSLTTTPRLTVDGTNEVTVAGRIRIMSDGNYGWNGNSQYTTFDTRQNLRLTGGIMTAPTAAENYQVGRRLRKCGAGKLILDYTQDDYPANSQKANTIEFCIDRGTLEICKSNALVRTQALSLYGDGNVTSAANVNTDVALLTLGGTNAANTINFAAGSSLTCTNLAFTANAKGLSLTGEVGPKTFRVGTEKFLTSAQLSRVRINGHHAVQDRDGYLIPGGFAMVIR